MADILVFSDTLKDAVKTLGGVNSVNAITAKASGTQATATPLTGTINRITVCATIADAVLLPVSYAGAAITVINSGATAAQVFGVSPDTINAAATATGVALASTKTATYYCPIGGLWFALLSA